MGSNFYRSSLKKEFMIQAPKAGFDILLFNNRGAEKGTVDERFVDALEDIDAALQFGRAQGYRRFVLIGHSTGCQKIAYYQAVRRRKEVEALVLLAPADDHALCRRDLGRAFNQRVRQAKRLVAQNRGHELISGLYEPFSARRFLSVADPKQLEARIFDYEGDLSHFRRLRCPVLAVFGAQEEFAVLPVPQMLDRLRAKTRSRLFAALEIKGADHGFHGCEKAAARAVCRWIEQAL
ncbi:MAG: hypothetical protein A2X46_06995 [Lentisphaerae bacterium GWF2_57_35]|nr:MAG: hypothetical protein A2X46_06995 [Lentisphaerae bacterium GWF2_57_35]